jgi:acyl-CoA thioesterase-1
VEEAFPSVLQGRLDAQGYAFEVVNAGVSGDTSAGGLRRLEWALNGDVKVLIIALGGNDGLRGLPVSELKENLRTIVARARERHIKVLLVGIEAPPNFGERYTSEFRQAFRDVAREAGVGLVPFLLEGVAGIPALNQADGIHPTAEGARIMANTIWRGLEPLLASTPSS